MRQLTENEMSWTYEQRHDFTHKRGTHLKLIGVSCIIFLISKNEENSDNYAR